MPAAAARACGWSRRVSDFADALTSCKREAASSFGNDHVLIEKYILSPRHIEVQVFGDSHGNVVHLFERDCSLQRRHQKVIEEAPAPGMDAATREELCCAAIRAAKAVEYVGAGTIEFIADGSEGLRADRIWFMEMNTRLQVEHPVTEEITGVDLVEWQLRVASGEPLPLRQDEITMTGHAIEARLYAEDADNGFLPSPGRIEHLDYSAGSTPYARGNPRLDIGVEEGNEVPPFYDPMFGKLIAHDTDRSNAAFRLRNVVSDMLVWPIRTNLPLLCGVLSHMAEEELVADTGLLDRELARFLPANPPPPEALAWATHELVQKDFNPEVFGMHASLAGFRLNAPHATQTTIYLDGKPLASDFALSDFDTTGTMQFDVGEFYRLSEQDGFLVLGGRTHRFSTRPDLAHGGAASDGSILSPMPGKVISVEVAEGQAVTKGQKLLTLEAMKMEHTLTAPFDGTVADLTVAAGDQVQVEALLVRIEPSGD